MGCISINKIDSKSTYNFELIYDKYSPAIYGLILKIVERKETAEKVLVRVFVKGCDNIQLKPAYQSVLCYFLSLVSKEVECIGYKFKFPFKKMTK